MKYQVTIDIDEDILRHELDDNATESTEELVRKEFGWLQSSGISLIDIKEVDNNA